MAGLLLVDTDGFSFDMYHRNEHLFGKGTQIPKAKKTGTTICAIGYKDGIVLGADTRSTSGNMVAGMNTNKIHYLAENMWACGAGTSADTDKVTRMISSRLELHRLSTGKTVPIIAASRMIRQHLYRYQGHIGAALIIGGVDKTGSYIYSVHPHGSIDKLQYTAMGSGSLAALSVLEQNWKPDLSLEEAKQLVRDAIAAGVFNDLGSGNNIDLCIITKDGSEKLRSYEVAAQRTDKLKSYKFKPGSTAIISRTVIPLSFQNTIARQLEAEPMDIQ